MVIAPSDAIGVEGKKLKAPCAVSPSVRLLRIIPLGMSQILCMVTYISQF